MFAVFDGGGCCCNSSFPLSSLSCCFSDATRHTNATLCTLTHTLFLPHMHIWRNPILLSLCKNKDGMRIAQSFIVVLPGALRTSLHPLTRKSLGSYRRTSWSTPHKFAPLNKEEFKPRVRAFPLIPVFVVQRGLTVTLLVGRRHPHCSRLLLHQHLCWC
jgi:hypothetical protein